MTRRAAFIFAILTAVLFFPPLASAQTAPPGSCLTPSGIWCWPIAPLTYGDPCECPTGDGEFEAGVVQ